MDSLKSLMDRKDYELVIKLTENSQDINYLFYRISAFLAIGKGEEALATIKNNRKILEGDLSLLVKIHIEILCLLNNFDEAYEELKYYENLPYVSQQVEEVLREMPKFIREEEKKSVSSKELSNEELRKRLFSDDQNVVLPALDMLRDRDINMFLPAVEHVLMDFPKQSIRSFALLLLVQKGLNREVKFNHIGQTMTVNPSKLEPPFIGNEFNDFLRSLQTELKNPAANENAIQILSSYIIYTYPVKLEIRYDVLTEALRAIAFEYLQSDEDIALSERCVQKGINEQEVKDLIQRIKDCLEDF